LTGRQIRLRKTWKTERPRSSSSASCSSRPAVGLELPDDAYVFSNDPMSARPWNPGWATHKASDLAAAAGVKLHIKGLRHYTASQLLAARSDLRNTAARLGGQGDCQSSPRRRAPRGSAPDPDSEAQPLSPPDRPARTPAGVLHASRLLGHAIPQRPVPTAMCFPAAVAVHDRRRPGPGMRAEADRPLQDQLLPAKRSAMERQRFRLVVRTWW